MAEKLKINLLPAATVNNIKMDCIDKVIEENPTLANKPKYIKQRVIKRFGLYITENDVKRYYFRENSKVEGIDKMIIYKNVGLWCWIITLLTFLS